jgi:hypothetical protein
MTDAAKSLELRLDEAIENDVDYADPNLHQLLVDIRKELQFLRKVAGAVSPGMSHADYKNQVAGQNRSG